MTNPGPRYTPLLSILRSSEAIWEASRVFFDRWDLSPSQFNILNLLRNNEGGLSQVELSKELIVHRSNITGLVDRLEKRGLVLRKASTIDRRVWRVVLSAKGNKLVQEILPVYYRMAEEIWGEIAPANADKLARDLEKVGQRAASISETEVKHEN